MMSRISSPPAWRSAILIWSRMNWRSARIRWMPLPGVLRRGSSGGGGWGSGGLEEARGWVAARDRVRLDEAGDRVGRVGEDVLEGAVIVLVDRADAQGEAVEIRGHPELVAGCSRGLAAVHPHDVAEDAGSRRLLGLPDEPDRPVRLARHGIDNCGNGVVSVGDAERGRGQELVYGGRVVTDRQLADRLAVEPGHEDDRLIGELQALDAPDAVDAVVADADDRAGAVEEVVGDGGDLSDRRDGVVGADVGEEGGIEVVGAGEDRALDAELARVDVTREHVRHELVQAVSAVREVGMTTLDSDEEVQPPVAVDEVVAAAALDDVAAAAAQDDVARAERGGGGAEEGIKQAL